MKHLSSIFWCFSCIHLVISRSAVPTESSEEWTGRWFPEKAPTTPLPVMEVAPYDNNRLMGIENVCDDGKTNLSVDNPDDVISHLCMTPRNQLWPTSLPPILEFQNIPAAYVAEHRCMNESIVYDSVIPTFGTHRQLWPIYGEYKFLPAQRWIHTLEHGGIVALYHPCADSRSIKVFKKTVAGCLRRHVITPWPQLSKSRAFALVAWGVRMEMSNVNADAVRQFIQAHALQGPEKLSKEGQFNDLLLRKAEIVSDFDDSQLCPLPLAHD